VHKLTKCTILILTYKGKHHLEFLLPTVKEAIAKYNGQVEIEVMIVDNGSDENTRAYVSQHFPSYLYLFSPINDYLFSLNSFIRRLDSEFMLILNDDMKLDVNILNALIPIIQRDPELFAVSCRIMNFDGTNTASAVRMARYKKGWMENYYLDSRESQIKFTLYPGGGAAVFRTEFFNKLGGFDALYRPAYYEDADLGIRAWQQGWKSLYNPSAVLYHREGGTISDQFKSDLLDQTINRNKILCALKNTRFPGFLGSFFLFLPYRIIFAYFTNRNMFKAWMQALRRFPQALSKRRKAGVIVKDPLWITMLDRPYIERDN